ncbi:MAG: hypothetical protein AB1405_03665 [Bdellovibrionota bacterium]
MKKLLTKEQSRALTEEYFRIVGEEPFGPFEDEMRRMLAAAKIIRSAGGELS